MGYGALAAAKGSINWTSEISRLRFSSWCRDPQQISPNGPNLSSSAPLRSAVRRENWLFLSPADTRQQLSLKRRKRTKRQNSSVGKSLVECCSVHLTVVWDTETQGSDSSPTNAGDAALRSFTSRRWLLRCASTCTDAGGDPCSPQPSATPTSCRPVLGFSTGSWHHGQTCGFVSAPLWPPPHDWILQVNDAAKTLPVSQIWRQRGGEYTVATRMNERMTHREQSCICCICSWPFKRIILSCSGIKSAIVTVRLFELILH